MAPSRILFLKLNNFSTNSHINSLPTLPYSPHKSKPGKLKVKPLWPKTRYQWNICYIPINTFSIVKFTDPNTTCMENESYLHITSPITHFQSVDQYYTIFKINRRPFNNQLDFWQNLSENRTLLVLLVNN